MYRAQVRGNRILNAQWDRERHQRHRNRLRTIKARIDNQPPKQYSHLVNRTKKEQMLEERYSKIEKENRILLKKMSYIMSQNKLDNKNKIKPRSLNSYTRRRKLEKIMKENQMILKRIQNRKAYYNRRDWAKHSKRHDDYLDNMRERQIRASRPRLRRRQHTRSLPALRHQPHYDEDQYGHGGDEQYEAKNNAFHRQISKGGRSIDGQYVIVTVDELLKPEHAMYFRTYDLDSGDHDGVKVPFDRVADLVQDDDPDLLSQPRREELATLLLSRLRFQQGRLTFDITTADDKDARARAMKDEAESYLQQNGAASNPSNNNNNGADMGLVDEDGYEEDIPDDAKQPGPSDELEL